MEALQYFARLGPQAKPHVVEVIKLTKDPDPNLRVAALAVVFAAAGVRGECECGAAAAR
jgi:hypothetical protein